MSLNIAPYIDHTVLKPETTLKQIEKLCAEAKENQFFSVCVNSFWVPKCKELLKNSSVKVCSVVGFPLGAMSTAAKSFETTWCIENGADEIDMVINVGALKDNLIDLVTEDIKAVVTAAKGKTVKVILETCLLTYDEKVKACEASLAAGAHFVKTSTGFSSAGATLDDVTLMKKVVGSKMKVKASGGIKNSDQAKAYITAGAERLGTSSGIEIIKGLEAKGSY